MEGVGIDLHVPVRTVLLRQAHRFAHVRGTCNLRRRFAHLCDRDYFRLPTGPENYTEAANDYD